MTKNTYIKCNVIVSVGFHKKFKDNSNVSKITYKQHTITISIENKLYKYLYISIDDIGTNLWTPRTNNGIHSINVQKFTCKSSIKS